jgi:hypothetical protein
VLYLSGGQITLPPTVIIGHAVTKKCISVFCVELNNGHCDIMLSVEEYGRFFEVSSYRQLEASLSAYYYSIKLEPIYEWRSRTIHVLEVRYFC